MKIELEINTGSDEVRESVTRRAIFKALLNCGEGYTVWTAPGGVTGEIRNDAGETVGKWKVTQNKSKSRVIVDRIPRSRYRSNEARF